MKQQVVRIFANAIVGALASALTLWLGASAGEAVVAGSAGSATLGDFVSNEMNAALAAVS